MSRVLAIVEGQTEYQVLNTTVAPYLGSLGVYLYPKIIGRPGHKGGVRSFDSVQEEILALYGQDPDSLITTFFDYYALPSDWPGVASAQGRSFEDIPTIIESAIRNRIQESIDDSGPELHFQPYIQMYELEALLFADPLIMAAAFEQPNLSNRFVDIVAECGGCERIDDGSATAPSKRIENLFTGYRKGRDKGKAGDRRPHAPLITSRIGIATLKQKCPRFGSWLDNLESRLQA